MPDIPTRLLVISARVPEGEKCIPVGAKTGCQFLGVSSTHYIPRCHLYEEDMCDLDRLPACRERDGWRCYPPDSGVAELVEAAREAPTAMSAALEASIDDPEQIRVTNERWSTADDELYKAARKVAKESNDVPRD